MEFPPEIQAELNRLSELSLSERLQEQCDQLNRETGNLAGYDCPDCFNRGFAWIVRNEEIIQRMCHCTEIRSSMRRISQSGLAGMLDSCTFQSYNTGDFPWQELLKQAAQRFVLDCNGKWFYAGGQVGSGKTHVCTAIVGELLSQGMSARYMLWRDEVVQLKACVNNDAEYGRLINPLKSVDVLYIDDLFKTGGKDPTDADVNIAFELLNHRYINKNLVTIISGERNMDELLAIDEAVGSRIYERTKEYCLIVPRKSEYNYRMR